jgi:hypothetical protein
MFIYDRAIINEKQLRLCSVVGDWRSGLISSRITSLIYIYFNELERIPVYSCGSEQSLTL